MNIIVRGITMLVIIRSSNIYMDSYRDYFLQLLFRSVQFVQVLPFFINDFSLLIRQRWQLNLPTTFVFFRQLFLRSCYYSNKKNSNLLDIKVE